MSCSVLTDCSSAHYWWLLIKHFVVLMFYPSSNSHSFNVVAKSKLRYKGKYPIFDFEEISKDGQIYFVYPKILIYNFKPLLPCPTTLSKNMSKRRLFNIFGPEWKPFFTRLLNVHHICPCDVLRGLKMKVLTIFQLQLQTACGSKT